MANVTLDRETIPNDPSLFFILTPQSIEGRGRRGLPAKKHFFKISGATAAPEGKKVDPFEFPVLLSPSNS